MKIADISEKQLRQKIQALRTWVWGDNLDEPKIDRWLENFSNTSFKSGTITLQEQKFLGLFLLSCCTFFNLRELRAMIRALYRDLVEYPAIQRIKRENQGISLRDASKLLQTELSNTRFVPVGNPSESGAHILYYFRQENKLKVDHFLQGIDIMKLGLKGNKLRHPQVKHYIFIDDICGSGSQARDYGKHICGLLRKSNNNIKTTFLALVATKDGLKEAQQGGYDNCASLFSLDDSFRVFEKKSRYFELYDDGPVQRERLKELAIWYGSKLMKSDPLGKFGGQLLLSFAHNTPNNTLPIFWSNKNGWSPVMQRFGKSL